MSYDNRYYSSCVCPNCGGDGEVFVRSRYTGGPFGAMASPGGFTTCFPCGGTGRVSEGDRADIMAEVIERITRGKDAE